MNVLRQKNLLMAGIGFRLAIVILILIFLWSGFQWAIAGTGAL